jgi:hypothetical protein
VQVFVALAFLCILSGSARAFDVPRYYEQNNNQTFHNRAEFLKSFPYDEYLKTVNLTDCKTLQRDRFFLYTKLGDGDEFLYNLGERFLALFPIKNSPGDLNQKIQIGEALLKPNKGFRREVNEIYLVIGYFILGKVAQKIGQEILQKRYNEGEPERAAIIQRLAKDRVYISREESTASKIAKHFLDWGYLWQRVQSLVHTHKKAAWAMTLVMMFACIILIVIGKKGGRNWLKRAGIAGIIAAIVPLAILLTAPRTASATKTSGPAPTSLKLVQSRFMYPGNNGSDHAEQIFKVLDSGGEIGQAIWLDRGAVQASYLSFENVPAKYKTYQSGHHVILATTGGYTNADHQPEGFTTEEGNVVNPVLMPDRHGLALVNEGGINVLNIKSDEFTLPKGPTIKNPKESLSAYGQLLKWCRSNKATVFQTHLLAYGDLLLIDPQKADSRVRERRILALARNKTTGQISHVVFNISSQYALARIAAELFGLLQNRNMKVEAMLNLDVGSYNILYAYDENGNLLQDVKGQIDISQATNLLIYTH